MKTYVYILLLMVPLFMMGCTPTSEEVASETPVTETESVKVEEEAKTDEDTGTEMDAEEVKAEYRKITAEEAKELMVEGNLIVDVRTQQEYDSGHIEGATLVPLDTLMRGEFTSLPDKDQVILVYCRSGNRSKSGAQILVEAGYTQVYDFGGVNTWPDDLVK